MATASGRAASRSLRVACTIPAPARTFPVLFARPRPARPAHSCPSLRGAEGIEEAAHVSMDEPDDPQTTGGRPRPGPRRSASDEPRTHPARTAAVRLSGFQLRPPSRGPASARRPRAMVGRRPRSARASARRASWPPCGEPSLEPSFPRRPPRSGLACEGGAWLLCSSRFSLRNAARSAADGRLDAERPLACRARRSCDRLLSAFGGGGARRRGALGEPMAWPVGRGARVCLGTLGSLRARTRRLRKPPCLFLSRWARRCLTLWLSLPAGNRPPAC